MKFQSKIADKFHKMIDVAQPSNADIEAAKKELGIKVPDYVAKLPNMSDFKKREIENRYVVNSVKHLIENEKNEFRKMEKENSPTTKLMNKLTKKKMVARAVMESVMAGEISQEDAKFLLDILKS